MTNNAQWAASRICQLERELMEMKENSPWAAYSELNDEYNKLVKERDAWKACAERLANAIIAGNNHGYGLRIGEEAVDEFNRLKGQS